MKIFILNPQINPYPAKFINLNLFNLRPNMYKSYYLFILLIMLLWLAGKGWVILHRCKMMLWRVKNWLHKC